MYQQSVAINRLAQLMLNICGFSYLEVLQRDKCAHLGLTSRRNIHLPPMENR